MIIFINENEALKNKNYQIPKELVNNLKKTLIQYKNCTTNKGYKRLNTLVNPNYNNRSEKEKKNNEISFTDLKRIDYDFRHMDKNPKNLERILNGGEELAQFAKDTLNRERTKVKPILQKKKNATRQKNAPKPIKKPTQPVKTKNVNENKKNIYITEKQIQKILNILR